MTASSLPQTEPSSRRRGLLRSSAVIIVAGLFIGVCWGGWRLVESSREAASRSACNLGQIRLAILNYHEEHGALPPATVFSRGGQPLHSWRVLILPFMDTPEQELYTRFRLNEPWDSKHNSQLLPQMPALYRIPYDPVRDIPINHTIYRVFTGPGALFEGGINLRDDCVDQKESTLLFVEAGEAIPWTKPDDFHNEPGERIVLDGIFPGYSRAMTVEGPYRFLRSELSQATLHALVTRSGDESLPENWSSHEPPPSSR